MCVILIASIYIDKPQEHDEKDNEIGIKEMEIVTNQSEA